MTEIEKSIPKKFIWNLKRIAKKKKPTTKKNKIEGLTHLDFKLNCKVAVIKTMSFWHRTDIQTSGKRMTQKE